MKQYVAIGGRDIHVSLTFSPIRDANGRIIGASSIIHDLTERQVQEGRIRQLRSQLANVQRLTELRQVLFVLVHSGPAARRQLASAEVVEIRPALRCGVAA
jgi:signal transduction histidine kinase